mmetsp:Transcript_7039/g.17294  ORF Transcript_7039/g.17294 Transcript_7039/m.17294 type:complete len:386 (+) Transcript_7039:385-1542(+)
MLPHIGVPLARLRREQPLQRAPPVLRQLIHRQLIQCPHAKALLPRHVPLGGSQVASEHAKEGRLSRPVSAHNGEAAAGADGELARGHHGPPGEFFHPEDGLLRCKTVTLEPKAQAPALASLLAATENVLVRALALDPAAAVVVIGADSDAPVLLRVEFLTVRGLFQAHAAEFLGQLCRLGARLGIAFGMRRRAHGVLLPANGGLFLLKVGDEAPHLQRVRLDGLLHLLQRHRVVLEPLVCHHDAVGRNLFGKTPVVCHDEQTFPGVLPRQVLLQSADGVDVQVVGRLVKQKQVGPVQQRANEANATPPASGQRFEPCGLAAVPEAEPFEQGPRLLLPLARLALALLDLVVQVAQALHRLLGGLFLALLQPLRLRLERPHPGARMP